MTPANEFRITKDHRAYVDNVEFPFLTGIELKLEPAEPIEILLRTFAWKIVIESDDNTRVQTYPTPNAEPCSEFRVTKDGHVLFDGAELSGVCGYCVDVDHCGDVELVLRVLVKTLDVESFSPVATDGTAGSSEKRLSPDSGCSRPRRRLFSWLPFPRKQSLYR